MLKIKQELLDGLAAALETLSRRRRRQGGVRIAQGGGPWRLRQHRGHAAGQAAQAEPAPARREPARGCCWRSRCTSAGCRRSTWPARASSTSASSPRPSSRSCARCCRALAPGSACSRPTGRSLMVEFVSANPTGPLHVGHGRQAALGDAICSLLRHTGLERAPRVLLQRRGRADRHPGHLHAAARAKGVKPGDAGWPEAAYNGDYIQDIANDFLGERRP
jgi:arginyl-tRNA synthetase